jgi:hypothetical protein
VLARYDPNIAFDPTIAGTYVGHDGVGAFLKDLVDLFVDLRTDYPDVRDLGDDRVRALGTARGRGVESGVETELTLAVVATSGRFPNIKRKPIGKFRGLMASTRSTAGPVC